MDDAKPGVSSLRGGDNDIEQGHRVAPRYAEDGLEIERGGMCCRTCCYNVFNGTLFLSCILPCPSVLLLSALMYPLSLLPKVHHNYSRLLTVAGNDRKQHLRNIISSEEIIRRRLPKYIM